MTKCTFHKYGTSGNIENHDVLCILPLNIVNEKIYLILWLWYILLILSSVVLLSWKALHVLCPQLRLATLSRLVKKSSTKGRMVRLLDSTLIYLE